MSVRHRLLATVVALGIGAGIAAPAAWAGPAWGPPGWPNSAPDPLSHPPGPPAQPPRAPRYYAPPPNPTHDPDVQRGIDSYRPPNSSR